MECKICGAWAPSDPATGYDADAICPSCGEAGWTETAHGVIVHERDITAEFEADQDDPRR